MLSKNYSENRNFILSILFSQIKKLHCFTTRIYYTICNVIEWLYYTKEVTHLSVESMKYSYGPSARTSVPYNKIISVPYNKTEPSLHGTKTIESFSLLKYHYKYSYQINNNISIKIINTNYHNKKITYRRGSKWYTEYIWFLNKTQLDHWLARSCRWCR